MLPHLLVATRLAFTGAAAFNIGGHTAFNIPVGGTASDGAEQARASLSILKPVAAGWISRPRSNLETCLWHVCGNKAL
jgi:hypothetical protein